MQNPDKFETITHWKRKTCSKICILQRIDERELHVSNKDIAVSKNFLFLYFIWLNFFNVMIWIYDDIRSHIIRWHIKITPNFSELSHIILIVYFRMNYDILPFLCCNIFAIDDCQILWWNNHFFKSLPLYTHRISHQTYVNLIIVT